MALFAEQSFRGKINIDAVRYIFNKNSSGTLNLTIRFDSPGGWKFFGLRRVTKYNLKSGWDFPMFFAVFTKVGKSLNQPPMQTPIFGFNAD